MDARVEVIIMSGVDDGTVLKYAAANGDGKLEDERWTLRVGRRDDNDICIRYDTYVSRWHAYLYRQDGQWYFEDLSSTNGSHIENERFEDVRIQGVVPLNTGQFVRVGRTWLQLQIPEMLA